MKARGPAGAVYGYVSVEDLEHLDGTRADAVAGRSAGPPYGGVYPPVQAGRWVGEAIGRAEELGVPGRVQVQWVLGVPREVLVGGFACRLPCCTTDFSGSRPAVVEHVNYDDEASGPSDGWLWQDWECGGCGRVPEPEVWHREPIVAAGLCEGAEMYVAPDARAFAERAREACEASLGARAASARLAAEVAAERMMWALEAGLPIGRSSGAVLFCGAAEVAGRLEEAQRANGGLGIGGLGAGLDGETVIALRADGAAEVCAVVDEPAAGGRFRLRAEPVAAIDAGFDAGRWAGVLLPGVALAELRQLPRGEAREALRREWVVRSFDAGGGPPAWLWSDPAAVAGSAREAILNHVREGLPVANEAIAAAQRAGALREPAAVDGGFALG